MKIREDRYITAMELRNLCVRNNWYTCGDNEEYAKLFQMADKENLTTDDLVALAKDIKEHSNTYDEVPEICFQLADIAVSVFWDEDEENR